MPERTFRPGDRVREGVHTGTIIGPSPRWRVVFDGGGEGTVDAAHLTLIEAAPTTDVVARAREALDGIDPGWTFQRWGQQNQNGDWAPSILFDADGETLVYELPDREGAFIAAAPALVRDLCAEVESLRALVESGKTSTSSAVAEAAREVEARLRAEAVVEGVRAAVGRHPDPDCDLHPDGDIISCGWKRAYRDVLRALRGEQ